MGDMRSGEDGTNVHGLFGAIIIEPPASKYYHNIFNIKKNYEEQSVITAPGVESFREFVLFAHNGIRLLERRAMLSRPPSREKKVLTVTSQLRF